MRQKKKFSEKIGLTAPHLRGLKSSPSVAAPVKSSGELEEKIHAFEVNANAYP